MSKEDLERLGRRKLVCKYGERIEVYRGETWVGYVGFRTTPNGHRYCWYHGGKDIVFSLREAIRATESAAEGGSLRINR